MYEDHTYHGRPVEGLLFNSRMVQAVFDDECPETRHLWKYPDTGQWDPDRNTEEFCQHLPEYYRYGLRAVTVGLQGGGSIYTPEVYARYINSAYRPDGSFKTPYFNRLARIIEVADRVGMVVIVNYFYIQQAKRIQDEKTVFNITEKVTDWLLRTGHRNILVDVANEAMDVWPHAIFRPDNIHRLIRAAQSVSLQGRRLMVGASTCGGDAIPTAQWRRVEDMSMPHGNGCTPEELKQKLQRLKDTAEYQDRPRPLLINEDSVFVENMEAALDEYASWGFYCQGYGSDYKDRMNWKQHPREDKFEELSGFQTVPVNWGINTRLKRRFFQCLDEITGSV